MLFALFDILEGDVLLPRPSWVSYEPQVLHAGERLFWIETNEHDRHTMTEETLNETYDRSIAQGANPKIMLINSPSNPTGQVFSAAQIQSISSFCREKRIILISDEIYSDLCFNPSATSVSGFDGSTDESANVILTGGLSKVSKSDRDPFFDS